MDKKNKSTHWLRTTLIVLIACGIASTILAGVMFIKESDYKSASSSIEFSFEGATDGKAPNGFTFDLNGFSSNQVLNTALENAGMADRYTAEQIRGQLTITGDYPDNIVSQMTNFASTLDGTASKTLAVSDYHPTTYSVTLNNRFDKSISSDDLKMLLGCIMDAYQSYFAGHYSIGAPNIELGYDLGQYDFPQQLTLLSQSIERAKVYSDEMYQKKPTLMLNRKGFNDISIRFKDLLDTDISKLNATITINHLTKDESRLWIQYEYEIQSLNNELSGKRNQLSKLNKLINSYEKNEVIYVSAYGSLTKIDGNSSETYDQLVTMQKKLSDEITDINTRISAIELQIHNMASAQDAANSDDVQNDESTIDTPVSVAQNVDTDLEIDEALLNDEISRIEAKRQAVMKDFTALINLYNDQQINDQTVTISAIGYNAPKLLSGAFVRRVLLTAGPVCSVGFMVCLVMIIISRKKEEKEK